MRTRTLSALAALAMSTCLPALAAVELSVTGEARQEVNSLEFTDRYQSLAGYLEASIGTDVKLVIGRDPTRELQKMRAGLYQVVVGPAHVIGAAMRYGYEPVARFAGEESAVFVASKASGIKDFDGAKGKRLALPPADSLATYLARGELNAKGVVVKSHFSEIREHRYHEVALMALEVGQAEVAVAESRVAKEWIARNGGTIIMETRATPGLGIAVNAKIDKATKDRIRAAFLSPNPRVLASSKVMGLDIGGASAITSEDYKYVSTLGYFTPRSLPGATMVTADQVADLMNTKGGILYDTRTPEEYNRLRIKGAKFLPYVEKSVKEVAFDATKDSFDVTKLPQDKNVPVIFACNGAECWKSYKAAALAHRAGHKQVSWFRGGFPEWSIAGLPTESTPGNLAQK